MCSGWFVIANCFSNSGKTKKSINQIKRCLDLESIEHTIYQTKNSGDEIMLVEEATKKGYNRILGIGGDGTAQKIVAGIVIQKNIPSNKVLFALIPSGTGNDWAKSKKIPLDISKSILLLTTYYLNAALSG